MSIEEFLSEWRSTSPSVLVHTSGSTGTPKPLWVEKRRMEASARITCDFLDLRSGDTALLCMSLDYIAGKMMVVRSLVRGLRLFSVEPCGHPLSVRAHQVLPSPSQALLSTLDFAAMVPMQVYNSLQVPEERERLMAIRHLIIGGGAIDDALASELKMFPHAVWSTYGMTETLSHIALRRLNGPDASEWYTPFPTVAVSLSDDGCLQIAAPEVCAEVLTTNDIAEMREGRFRIIGRKDNTICSGGLKIQAEEVERLLKPYLQMPYLITKCKDAKFGETVVLLIEGDIENVPAVCRKVLPKHWQPKHYLSVSHIPQTETGKPARSRAQQLVEERIR